MTTVSSPGPDVFADFPVVWDDPADAALSWSHNRVHHPGQITPLSAALRDQAQGVGMMRAGIALDRPTVTRFRRLNTYAYTAASPIVPRQAGTGRHKRSDAKYLAIARKVGAYWAAHLPEVEAILAALDAAPVEQLPLEHLVVELEYGLARVARLWEIHFLVVPSALVAISQFEQLHRELFGDAGAFEAVRLLQGVETKTVEAARELWRLSRIADERQREEALGAYLDRYGRRGVTMDPALPSLIEDPTTVRRDLADLIADRGRDPIGRHRELVAERELAVAETFERLRGYPQPVVDEYRTMLAAAQDGTTIMETHNFYIDFGSAPRLRRIVLALARHLVSMRVLPAAEDVWLLVLDELRDAAVGSPPDDLSARIEARRAEMARFAGVVPPATVGEPALPAPAGGASAPTPPAGEVITRAMMKFFGGPPAEDVEPGTVRGHPGSPGRRHGPARVIHSPSEAGRVRAGDVLVTEMTAAPWTPLFAKLAGLVTDTGGILSHSAIVAREYGIPAVVGTHNATARIADGDLVEVDGDRGIVRIVTAS
jgi:phosphohistidine swiveling domain-containing protein